MYQLDSRNQTGGGGLPERMRKVQTLVARAKRRAFLAAGYAVKPGEGHVQAERGLYAGDVFKGYHGPVV